MTDSRDNLFPEYASRLAGGWKCTSYELHATANDDNNTTTIHKPHGDTPLGRVLISPQGWLAAHLAIPDRFGPLPSGRPWQTAPDGEVARVARGLSMYCGYVRLFEDEEGLYWETRVEVSSDPTWKGELQVRRVELGRDGRSMTLRPVGERVMEDGTKTRGVLKWERFE